MSERGSASVVAAAIVSGLVLIAAALVDVGVLVAAHVQATAAADAAALAAAPLTFLGGDPAGEAADFAVRNGARLERCRCSLDPSLGGRVVHVEVAKAVDLALFGSLTVRARSAAEFTPTDLLADG